MLKGLKEAFDEAHHRRDVKAIVVTGEIFGSQSYSSPGALPVVLLGGPPRVKKLIQVERLS